MAITKTGKRYYPKAVFYRCAAKALAFLWAIAPEGARVRYSKKHYPESNALAAGAALEKIIVRDGPLPAPTSPILVCSLRDEIDKIAEFLRHHRALGIRRFVFVDNNSKDGTREFLTEQPDCDLWLGPETYSPDMQNAWRIKICDIYTNTGGGRQNRWFLSLDADELLVWDGCEDMKIESLVRKLSRRGIRHARAQMVDMYRAGRALDPRYDADMTLAENYPYFDADYTEEIQKFYNKWPFPLRKGGPRFTFFRGSDGERHAPFLTKIPLFYFRRGETFESHAFEQWWLNFSPCHLGLLHFKFLPGAMAKIKEAVKGGYHWNGSFEYKILLDAFTRSPDLSFISDRSRRYASSRSLVRAGIIRPL
jgi:hypothetical protein